MFTDILQYEIRCKIRATMKKYEPKPQTRAIWIVKGAIFFNYLELSYLFSDQKEVPEHVDAEDVMRRFKIKKNQTDEEKKVALVCEYSANTPDYDFFDIVQETRKRETQLFNDIDNLIYQLCSYFMNQGALTAKESKDFDRIMEWLKNMTNDYSNEANEAIWNKVRGRYENIGLKFRAFIDFLESHLHFEHKCKLHDTPQFYPWTKTTGIRVMVKTHAKCPMKFHMDEWI